MAIPPCQKPFQQPWTECLYQRPSFLHVKYYSMESLSALNKTILIKAYREGRFCVWI